MEPSRVPDTNLTFFFSVLSTEDRLGKDLDTKAKQKQQGIQVSKKRFLSHF